MAENEVGMVCCGLYLNNPSIASADGCHHTGNLCVLLYVTGIDVLPLLASFFFTLFLGIEVRTSVHYVTSMYSM